MKKLKLSDLGHLEKLEIEKLSELKGKEGGISLFAACLSYACSANRRGLAHQCFGGKVCITYAGPG